MAGVDGNGYIRNMLYQQDTHRPLAMAGVDGNAVDRGLLLGGQGIAR